MTAIVRRTQDEELARVRGFAEDSGVTTEGIDDGFYMMEDDEGNLQAVAALVTSGDEGVLRSLVIDSKQCGMGGIIHFFEALLQEAKKVGLKNLFLITKTPSLFELFGFIKLVNEAPPTVLLAKAEKDATVMRCTL